MMSDQRGQSSVRRQLRVAVATPIGVSNTALADISDEYEAESKEGRTRKAHGAIKLEDNGPKDLCQKKGPMILCDFNFLSIHMKEKRTNM